MPKQVHWTDREDQQHTIEVMTAQEWMQLGFPVFVSAALEEHNTSWAEDGVEDHIVSVEQFKAMTVRDQLEFALEWNGIIGCSSNIYESVTQLQDLKAGRRGVGAQLIRKNPPAVENVK